MIDHFTLTVRDLKASVAFYTAALKPLGYSVKMDFGEFVGFGDTRKPYFFLKPGAVSPAPQHIAFAAANRALVDAFHVAALAAGARDDGQPGLREQYHPHYYGAFVVDPDGHPIEAVCHMPAAAASAPAPASPKKAKAKVAKKKAPAKKAKRR
ncbi:MAG TPA: VOC family protein [Myxococcaceae bacterium]|jgi:catechol 2,3-dioxygenase-like lactoylglutathione lyase family enzyme